MTTALCPLGRSTKSPKFRPQFRPTMGRFFRGLQALVVEEVSLCRWRNPHRAPAGFRELAQLFLDVEPYCRANGDAHITSSASPGTLRGCARSPFARGELYSLSVTRVGVCRRWVGPPMVRCGGAVMLRRSRPCGRGA